MPREVYRYSFERTVSFTEALATLDLAILAAESLHGECRARLDARFIDDEMTRTIVIDASTEVGRCFNQVFVGFVRREFGDRSFRVERLDRLPARFNGASCP